MKFISQAQKLDPKLRVIANGNETVNAMRAERSDSMAVRDEAVLEQTPSLEGTAAIAFSYAAAAPPPAPEEREPLEELPSTIYINIYVQLAEGLEGVPDSIRRNAEPGSIVRRLNLLSASVPISALPEITADPNVVAVERTENIIFAPPLDVHEVEAGPQPGWQRAPGLESGNGGKGVIVGIIDVQGFDFAHPDFLDAEGKTRFIRIWDQGGQGHEPPPGFGYGAEITAEMMNAALEASKTNGIAATHLEPQSQMDPSSHGTHVSSIAAGNFGVAPQAVIAAVLVSLPESDLDRRKSFYDSTRITHAVNYLFELGDRLGMPVAVNISLGTNGHAHDGSSVSSRWIDYALTSPGRCVSVAAGNAGQEKAAEPGDWGWVMGRIHTSGSVPQNGTVDIEWVVLGDSIADLSENEMELWYNSLDHFGVQIKPPNGEWTEILQPGEYIENRDLPNRTFLSIYNELYSPANGVNHIAIYLSPLYSRERVVGISPGTWTVRLHGLEVRDGSYHAWIERDDPRRLGKLGRLEAWSFPSFLSELSNVDRSSVSSLGCGHNLVSVANLDEARLMINITSSQGPTRDGRNKPDVAAPGTDILAANAFSPDNLWVRMTGTSMASPYITGLSAQLLSVEPGLTSPQICAILSRTARGLARQANKWLDDAGYGMVDPGAALAEVRRYQQRKDVTK